MGGHSLNIRLERVEAHENPRLRYRPVLFDNWGTFFFYDGVIHTQKAAFEYAEEKRTVLEHFME